MGQLFSSFIARCRTHVAGIGGGGGAGGGGALPAFATFRDSYTSVADLQADLQRLGLESSQLIVGVDFTKSNEWTGRRTFGGRSLHTISTEPNPYERAISIMGATLSAFDDDNMIPAYGFGCARTHDDAVFSLRPRDAPCDGFAGVLAAYRATAPPATSLAGPTSFGPIVRKAMAIVKESGGQLHILVIVADGQVTRPEGMPAGQLSVQEQDTVSAIVAACALPLVIIIIGVGDGPWEQMEEFDDRLPERAFDNLQFVPFEDTMLKSRRASAVRQAMGGSPDSVRDAAEATFALHALMELPDQIRAIARLGLQGRDASDRVHVRAVRTLEPPPSAAAVAGVGGSAAAQLPPPPPPLPSLLPQPPQLPPQPLLPPQPQLSQLPQLPQGGAERELAELREAANCIICAERPKSMAFGCGHTFCSECGAAMQTCPVCRRAVTSRVVLY